jgi:hypothetical protein
MKTEDTMHADPSAGTTQPTGKSSDAEATLAKHFARPTEAVRQVEEVKGAARKAIDIQDGFGNNNPKKRSKNYWGTSSEHED